MPAALRDPDDPHEWLRRARSSLARVRAGRADAAVLYEDLCFDAQQAAEKAIKAVLVDRKVRFPKTHSIEELLALVEGSGLEVSHAVREAARLTRYAALMRYPVLMEDVTEEEYRAAGDLAERVLRWAETATG